MPHLRFLEHRLQDLRFAVRQLVRYRGYGAAAVVVPALGIAATVALFGFVDAAMIKPLPYGEPSRLFTMFGTTPDLAPGRSRGQVSYLDFRDWRQRNRTFSSIAAYDVRAGFTVTTAAGPERVAGLRVTSGFFRTLGVTPLMGATLVRKTKHLPETPSHPSAYVPFDQPAFALAVRLSPTAPTPSAAIRSAIREIRPDALIGDLTTMTERANRLPSVSLNRSTAWLAGSFAALAGVLSVVGLYGVIAYSVGRRTREIGVRIALGAERRTVCHMVLREASWLAGSGIALGGVCAILAATVIRDMLFDVPTQDPVTLLGAALILFVSAVVSCYVPARRAASVDPVAAMRDE